MNPSEDPNDRLVDSLLRESARGGADQLLLDGIAAKLDAAPSPAGRHRVPILPWLVAAACLTILGIGWALWHRDEARGGKSEPHPVAESGSPATKVAPSNGSQPSVTRPISPSPRDSTEVIPIPVPVPSGDVAVTPKPDAIEGDTQANPPGSGSQTLRDFAERRVAIAGEGMRIRGLSFPADPALTEVFVYDPGAPAISPATRIDVSTHLGGPGQFLSLKGDRMIVSDLAEVKDGMGFSNILGTLKIPEDTTDGILMLLPGAGKPGFPARRATFLDMSAKIVPPGSVLVVNLSPAEVALQLEKEMHRFKPGEQRVIKEVPLGPSGVTSIGGFREKGGQMQKILSAVWPAHETFRSIQIFFHNPQSGMIEVRGYRDRTSQVDEVGDRKKEDSLDGLAYVRDESIQWYVQFNMAVDGKWSPFILALTSEKKRLMNKPFSSGRVKPGETFFKEEPFANRFKFIGFEERDMKGERTGLARHVKFALYEDLKPNKRGMRYESQEGLPGTELTKNAYYDRTAVLKFGEKEFRVEEYTKFRLPGNASKKEHLLKKVTPQGVTIETMGANGKAITREITKGG